MSGMDVAAAGGAVHTQTSVTADPATSVDATAGGGAVVSASAPALSRLNGDALTVITTLPSDESTADQAETITSIPPAPVSEPTISSSPFAFKRRATSFSDRLPLRSPASSAKSAVATAFASVSSATTTRFAKFRSLSSDNFMRKNNANTSAAANGATTATGTTAAAGAVTPRSAWKVNMNDFARRAKEAAKRAKSGTRYSWGDESEGRSVKYVSGVFEYHGEDAGAVSSYFHIVADGVSAPFGRNSLANITHEPVSSALIAKELVRTVQQALNDVTNSNSSSIDLKIFESVVVDAIKATRIKCFQHRQSRIAATLSVSYFDRWNGKLLTFSLGDSKCIVVRNGAIVFETPAVLRDFNMPTVVNLSHQVVSADYVLQSFTLQENDVCMTFSDGIGDNLYKHDITSAVVNALLLEKHSVTDGDDATAALQKLCDELVFQSQMKISVERAQALMAENDLKKLRDEQFGDEDTNSTGSSSSSNPDIENEHPNTDLLNPVALARISIHNAPVRGLFPFATAAALEYRARALEECFLSPSSSSTHDEEGGGIKGQVDHLACSLALFEKHQHKQTLSRQELVRKAQNSRKRHYNLTQLKRMAEMQTKKPDDITLFLTHFR